MCIKIKQYNKIINIVERIFYFNQLEQKEERLKILTPNQVFSRLPIILAQVKTRNNSEKLKSKIRPLMYSLYRSKRLTKNVCKNLMNS